MVVLAMAAGGQLAVAAVRGTVDGVLAAGMACAIHLGNGRDH